MCGQPRLYQRPFALPKTLAISRLQTDEVALLVLQPVMIDRLGKGFDI